MCVSVVDECVCYACVFQICVCSMRVKSMSNFLESLTLYVNDAVFLSIRPAGLGTLCGLSHSAGESVDIEVPVIFLPNPPQITARE